VQLIWIPCLARPLRLEHHLPTITSINDIDASNTSHNLCHRLFLWPETTPASKALVNTRRFASKRPQWLTADAPLLALALQPRNPYLAMLIRDPSNEVHSAVDPALAKKNTVEHNLKSSNHDSVLKQVGFPNH
jgi:hypothetical protein